MWPSVGGREDEMHRSRAGGESREKDKGTTWLGIALRDHARLIYVQEDDRAFHVSQVMSGLPGVGRQAET